MRSKPLQRVWVGSHPPVGAGTDDQVLGQVVHHLVQIFKDQRMPVLPPPAPHHPMRQDDQVARSSWPSTTIRPNS
jgi:hypothetical protein